MKYIHPFSPKVTCLLVTACGLSVLHAYEEDQPAEKEASFTISGHVFGWPFLKAEKMQPRGGTSTGGEVTLFKGEKPSWKELQKTDFTLKERDRAAILAMQGSYRMSFDFMETAGFTPDYKPARPYFSWGTERIILLKDEPDFISLQHVMVMYFKDEDGKESGPHIMKHWRQDWTYQDSTVFEFQGDNTWKKRELSDKETKGTWTQAVFQVDDSPRYEVTGTWEHMDGKSTWSSENVWRPVPRREASVRKDYNVLGGKHEITITPNGWVHLQNNRKLIIEASQPPHLIAHEIGINRYEEITKPDLKAGDKNFYKAEPYWAEVRKKWQDIYDTAEIFKIKREVGDKKLFAYHFEYAAKVEQDGWQEEAGKKHATETIELFLEE